jgi:GNAT superfamily N-acetyltransferase
MTLASMERLTITELRAEHLPAAAELLAARQARLREVRPELPEAFTHTDACHPILEELLAKEGAHGVVALRDDGSLAGYLAGWHRTEEIWGRACWSPIEGHALAAGVEAERVRDLYAAWAEHFVGRGIYRHYVHTPADDAEMQAAWFRTGFGQMQAHATREIPPGVQAPEGTPFTIRPGGPNDAELQSAWFRTGFGQMQAHATREIPPGVQAPEGTPFTIRPGGPNDAELLFPLFPVIPAALMLPPAYAISLPERFESLREDYEGELSEPQARIWLAEEAGMALGKVAFEEPEAGPMVPDHATEMAVGMTLSAARGRGIIRALVETASADARERGIRWVITDWRTASLSTHRSWVALGHRPLYYRLHRHIDERIAWARQNQEAAPG